MDVQVWWRRLHSRAFVVDSASGVLLAVLALAPPVSVTSASLPAALLTLLSVAVRRVSPGAALLLVWLMAVVEIALGERPNLTVVAILLVLYAAARMGLRWEVVAGGVSAVIGGFIATAYLGDTGARYLLFRYGSFVQEAVATIAPVGVLLSAWMLGLVTKYFVSQRTESELRVRAESQTARALDVAQVERARATMARDVHDIVGHSLAVIIAQADSVEFLDEEARIRAVTAVIAETARRSLQEVRDVLSGTTVEGAADEPRDLETIVEQVRAAGIVVDRVVRGRPRPGDGTQEVVVRRVVQEMMTNALRHGAPGHPVVFRETWRSADVVLEVENQTGPERNPGTGLGIDGMRSRLEAIGGDLDAEPVDGVFVARARVPFPAEALREVPGGDTGTPAPAVPPFPAHTLPTDTVPRPHRQEAS